MFEDKLNTIDQVLGMNRHAEQSHEMFCLCNHPLILQSANLLLTSTYMRLSNLLGSPEWPRVCKALQTCRWSLAQTRPWRGCAPQCPQWCRHSGQICSHNCALSSSPSCSALKKNKSIIWNTSLRKSQVQQPDFKQLTWTSFSFRFSNPLPRPVGAHPDG